MGKVRPHRLYKKKNGKLYIKKGNKKVFINSSMSLQKIVDYVSKHLKTERIQPRKQVKKQETSKPLAVVPVSHNPKQDFAASILNNKSIDTPLNAVASLTNAVNNIKAPVKDNLYSEHVKASEAKVANEEAKQAEAKRMVATTDMDKYIKMVSLLLTTNLAKNDANPWSNQNANQNAVAGMPDNAEANMDPNATVPLVKQADGADAQAQADQLDLAMRRGDPANEEKDGELVQDAKTVENMAEAERQRQLVDDAMYAEEVRRRGRQVGQTVDHSSASIADLKWFVETTGLIDDIDYYKDMDVSTLKTELNSIIIGNNEHLEQPFKIIDMTPDMDRRRQEFYIKAHLETLRIADYQTKAMNMNDRFQAHDKQRQADERAEAKRKTKQKTANTQLETTLTTNQTPTIIDRITNALSPRKRGKDNAVIVPEPQSPGSEMKADGKGLTVDTIKDEGMTGQEIETVLKKKLHTFIPVIACDEIPSLCKYINGNTQEFGFIINSDPHNKSGCHWRSIYISRPKAEIDFYDSLTSEPTDECLTGLKILMNKMNDPLYYVLKINRVKYQSNTTSTCGAFALKFLDDMYHGKKFKEATGYDDHINGEKDINKYISRWNLI